MHLLLHFMPSDFNLTKSILQSHKYTVPLYETLLQLYFFLECDCIIFCGFCHLTTLCYWIFYWNIARQFLGKYYKKRAMTRQFSLPITTPLQYFIEIKSSVGKQQQIMVWITSICPQQPTTSDMNCATFEISMINQYQILIQNYFLHIFINKCHPMSSR